MSRPATSRLKCNPVLGSPPTLEWRAVGELLIDPSYQRSIDTGPSQTLIRRIAMFWDWGLCQPLAVSRRPDGALTIVDGQHRASAAKLRGDIPHLPCVITSYANAGDEAAAFVALNQMRRPLSALDLFKAAVAAEDKEATSILKIVEEAGLRIAPHMTSAGWKSGVIGNVGGLKRCYQRAGEQVLRLALLALSRAWPDEVLRYAGTLFPGFAAVALDEVRLRGDPQQVAAELSRIAGSRSQAEWVCAVRAAGPEADGSVYRAAELVFRQAWRSRDSATLVLPEKAAAKSAPGQVVWCDQCDRRVNTDQIGRCGSPFCKAKAQAA